MLANQVLLIPQVPQDWFAMHCFEYVYLLVTQRMLAFVL